LLLRRLGFSPLLSYFLTEIDSSVDVFDQGFLGLSLGLLNKVNEGIVEVAKLLFDDDPVVNFLSDPLGFILSGKVLHHPKQVLRGLERNLVRKV
jgi:hypothetical protein